MIVAISQIERAALFPLFSRAGSWGGSEEILLGQDDLYRVLGLVEFEGKETVLVAELSSVSADVDIPDAAVSVLRQILVQAGQNPNSARIVACVLRRLKP